MRRFLALSPDKAGLGRSRSGWGWRYVFLLGVCLGLGGWAWARLQGATVFFDRRSPLPQHDLIQVYFNQNPLHRYVDPYRGHERVGDNLEQTIVDHILGAKSQVDVAVQELRSPLIAKALRDRQRAGVQVRVVLENTYSRPWSDYSSAEIEALDDHLKARYAENLRLIDRDGNGRISATEARDHDAIKILKLANIPLLDDTEDGSKGSGLVHHKFVVIDGQRVIVTSANFTLSDLQGDLHVPDSVGNANSLLVMQDVALAQAFTQEFELLWGDGPGKTPNSQFGVNKPHRDPQGFTLGDAQVWVKFSPDSASVPWEQTSNGMIDQHLAIAQQQINLALFVFSEQRLADQLAIAHQRGVKIHLLIDRSFAYRPYSEGLDLLGVSLPQSGSSAETPACQTEDNNQPWSSPIQTVGTPAMTPGDLLHHKFAVIDESMVVMGSHNWSEAANRLNDETLVAIASPKVAAHYQQEFERLYTNSRLGVPAKVETQWQAFLRQCSSQWATSNSQASTDSTELVNLNQASQAELEALPDIGPKTAIAILKAREKQPFTSLEDLDAVPGIGPKTLDKLRDRVTW